MNAPLLDARDAEAIAAHVARVEQRAGVQVVTVPWYAKAAKDLKTKGTTSIGGFVMSTSGGSSSGGSSFGGDSGGFSGGGGSSAGGGSSGSW